MNRVIIDTSVLLAVVDKKDKWNKVAEEIFDRLEEEKIEFYIFDCVANELLSVVGKRLAESKREKDYAETAQRALEYIKAEKLFTVYDLFIPKYEHIVKTILESNGKLSFHDALIVVAAQTYNLPYIISFDEDFDGIQGLKRIKNREDLESLTK